ncbi:tripartite tricarboxylate transporter substrate binding protein [Halomonas sp. TRM85114]|uniref:Bug family tripartite tricarboxylate transporter substrate binding protein n=1 Tax=Halomonas jincaotanensis TaxID=2810616 RepID=UPI001BD23A14|nr:tripartite tricarboxylate transporter substrate binding protein [Halomonas jincaotanensis]MBS9404918.1 tripartite tricarboxylate transporter substrate binding protein [Halomonas jincaotanensis]
MNARRTFLAGAVLACIVAVGSASPAFAYPDRPIQVIVPYPAGGGTDIVARTLAAEIEKELDTPINVINRGGGGGIVGSNAIARAQPDGYTIGLVASDISLYEPQGLADISYEDLTAIGQTNALASSITVIADSPYQTVGDLLTAIKENPGELKGTGAPQNANWHVGFLGLMMDQGIDPNTVIWVPTQGGTAGHLDVAAGNSTFSTASLAEARALIESGKLRALAVMADEPIGIFPDVPTLKQEGIDYTFGLWHGVVAPAGLPDEERQILLDAVENAVNSESFRNTLTERGFTIVWRPGDEFRDFMKSDYEAAQKIFGDN